MRQPGEYKAAAIVDSFQTTATGLKDGRWIPTRFYPWQHYGLRQLQHRLRLAWLVFTGKRDALDWEH